MAAYGYSQRFAKSNGLGTGPTSTSDGQTFSQVACNGGGPNNYEAFGNMVLVLGSVGVWSFPTDYYYQSGVQGPSDEVRNYSCIVAVTFAGNRMSCATHLEPTILSPPYSNTGMDDAAITVSNFYAASGYKLILGADRNRTDYRTWTNVFTEVDRRPSGSRLRTYPSPAASTTSKLDWIWGGPAYGGLSGTDRYCPNTPVGNNGWTSDHCMLYGQFRV